MGVDKSRSTLSTLTLQPRLVSNTRVRPNENTMASQTIYEDNPFELLISEANDDPVSRS